MISIRKSVVIIAVATTKGEDDNMLEILRVRIYHTSRRVDIIRIKIIKSIASLPIGMALS